MTTHFIDINNIQLDGLNPDSLVSGTNTVLFPPISASVKTRNSLLYTFFKNMDEHVLLSTETQLYGYNDNVTPTKSDKIKSGKTIGSELSISSNWNTILRTNLKKAVSDLQMDPDEPVSLRVGDKVVIRVIQFSKGKVAIDNSTLLFESMVTA